MTAFEEASQPELEEIVPFLTLYHLCQAYYNYLAEKKRLTKVAYIASNHLQPFLSPHAYCNCTCAFMVITWLSL